MSLWLIPLGCHMVSPIWLTQDSEMRWDVLSPSPSLIFKCRGFRWTTHNGCYHSTRQSALLSETVMFSDFIEECRRERGLCSGVYGARCLLEEPQKAEGCWTLCGGSIIILQQRRYEISGLVIAKCHCGTQYQICTNVNQKGREDATRFISRCFREGTHQPWLWEA